MSEYLPQDIVMKILSWLPPKPLIKFRCVSKSWYFMISSPHFIKLHTQHTLLSTSTSTSPHQMLLRRYSKPLHTEVYSVHTDDDEFHDTAIKIEYPFHDRVRFYYRIVGSCNGVLCLLDDQFGRPDAAAVQLWNPVIRRKLTLPAPPQSPDSATCMIVLGSGFDARSGDYKVVRITYVQGDECEYLLPPKVEVYALNSGSWHAVEGEIPHNCVVEYFWSQVFINGNVHWAAYKIMGRNSRLENVIMSFDLSREVFDEMPLPETLANVLSLNIRIVDLGGALAVVRYDERVWGTNCCIWVMREYGNVESWSWDYGISLDGGIERVLGARQNGDILVSARGGVLMAYHRTGGKYADLGLSSTKYSLYVSQYNESLLLLAEGTPASQRLPSDSDDDSDCAVEFESMVDDEENDRLGDVEKSEFWMQSSMSQYLTTLLKRPYI